MKVEAKLNDGAVIEVEVTGSGPALLLPVDPVPVTGPRADELRRWGTDPALGRSLVDGLADVCRVVAFPYEAHVLAHPRPQSLTPESIAADMLAVADAAGVERFTYYGYSWLALCGLQLAIRTGRLDGLAMGGYPPMEGPYDEMLKVTRATHELALAPRETPKKDPDPDPDGEIDWSTVEMTLSPDQTQQFVTLYEALQGFDDRAAQSRLTCPRRLCFAGTADQVEYEPRWGGVAVDMAGPLRTHREELRALGWRVELLDGLDHTTAMQPATVLPLLRSWLS
ncbi:MAG TPA: hypothetical protein VF062_04500 [Candidatus Limnocylindrales bacterium]